MRLLFLSRNIEERNGPGQSDPLQRRAQTREMRMKQAELRSILAESDRLRHALGAPVCPFLVPVPLLVVALRGRLIAKWLQQVTWRSVAERCYKNCRCVKMPH
eukprot:COSAG01_NODE_458_length_16743_cov_124.609208_12_plen_103_part_00